MINHCTELRVPSESAYYLYCWKYIFVQFRIFDNLEFLVIHSALPNLYFVSMLPGEGVVRCRVE